MRQQQRQLIDPARRPPHLHLLAACCAFEPCIFRRFCRFTGDSWLRPANSCPIRSVRGRPKRCKPFQPHAFGRRFGDTHRLAVSGPFCSSRSFALALQVGSNSLFQYHGSTPWASARDFQRVLGSATFLSCELSLRAGMRLAL